MPKELSENLCTDEQKEHKRDSYACMMLTEKPNKPIILSYHILPVELYLWFLPLSFTHESDNLTALLQADGDGAVIKLLFCWHELHLKHHTH